MNETAADSSKLASVPEGTLNKDLEIQEKDQPEETVEIVVFTMARRYFAFKGSRVREILPFSPVTWVPGCPGTLRGIINVRGIIESVVNLHTLLEIAEAPESFKTRFILGQSGEISSGIQVESVEDVISIEKNKIKSVVSTLPAATRKYALGGGAFYKGHYVVLLSVKKIFEAVSA